MDYARPSLKALEMTSGTACCYGPPLNCLLFGVPSQPPVFRPDDCKVQAGIVGALCFSTS